MSKRYTSLLFLLFALFITLFLILSFNSRLATDDYYFIGDIKTHGTFEQVWFQYMHWTGRFAATLPINIIYNTFGLNQIYYTLLPPLSYLLLLFGAYKLIKKLFVEITFSNAILFSFCFTSLLFFLSFDIGETWFWYCGYSSYLWSITAFIWACAFLISKTNSKWNTILAALCFVYIGGASEIFSAIVGLAYTVLLIYRFRESKSFSSFWNNLMNRKLMYTYLFFAISFIIFLIAPGNYLRDELFPEHHIFQAFILTTKSFVKLLFLYLPSKIIYILAFSVPIIFIGNSVSKHAGNIHQFKWIAKRMSIALLTLLFIFYLLVAFVMVETGPARILFFVTFLLSTYLSILSFLVGYFQVMSSHFYKNILKRTSLITAFSVLLFQLIQQTSISSTYASQNDERIAFITELNNRVHKDTLIYLTPLPPCGMLYSAEITADTNHFTNKELRMGYHLKFHVALEKP